MGDASQIPGGIHPIPTHLESDDCQIPTGIHPIPAARGSQVALKQGVGRGVLAVEHLERAAGGCSSGSVFGFAGLAGQA